MQSRTSGIPYLSGSTPRKGFRLGFARQTELTPVTFPHECMHRGALSCSLPSLLGSQQDGRRACLVSAPSGCVPYFCCWCLLPSCAPRPQPVLSLCFCLSWRLSPVSHPSPGYVMLRDCRNQPFPRSSAAEFSRFSL